jgi:M61 glycyl aminopeptidase
MSANGASIDNSRIPDASNALSQSASSTASGQNDMTIKYARRRRTLRLIAIVLTATAKAGSAATTDTPKYSVIYDPASAHAAVTLCLAHAHPSVVFEADSPGTMRFSSDVRRSSGGTLKRARAAWMAKDWHAGECLVYAADIGAVSKLHTDAGTHFGDVLVTDPQYWLLRADTQGAAGADLSIDLPDGWGISAPWRALGRDGKSMRFHIPGTPSDWSAAVALGRFEEEQIILPGGSLRVAILCDADAQQRAKLIAWIRGAAASLLTAYGQLPLPEVSISVVSIKTTSLSGQFFALLYPSAVFGGETARGQGNAIQLVVDPGRPDAEFKRDWTATHELTHTLHPYLGDRGNWLSEGLATYYQNILRARSGIFSQTEVWEHLASGFEDAASSANGESLEQAASSMAQSQAFQRVYWSGAAYWLNVDVDLRRASGGKLNLETALLRFHDCCLPSYREWTPEGFVANLDELMKVRVFSQRYREYAQMTRFPDWQDIFAHLGVVYSGGRVTLDANATDASIRQAITAQRH